MAFCFQDDLTGMSCRLIIRLPSAFPVPWGHPPGDESIWRVKTGARSSDPPAGRAWCPVGHQPPCFLWFPELPSGEDSALTLIPISGGVTLRPSQAGQGDHGPTDLGRFPFRGSLCPGRAAPTVGPSQMPSAEATHQPPGQWRADLCPEEGREWEGPGIELRRQ